MSNYTLCDYNNRESEEDDIASLRNSKSPAPQDSLPETTWNDSLNDIEDTRIKPSDEKYTREDLEKDKIRLRDIDHKLHKLYARRNKLAPKISRMPPELLTIIFSFCDDILPPPHRGYKHGPWHWFTVTHVCMHWRHVALNARPLWSRITDGWGPEWVEEAAQRAGKKALLTVIPGVSRNQRSKDAVDGILHRVVKLCIKVSRFGVGEAVDTGAPLLEDLTVILKDHTWGAERATAPALRENAPRLSRLTLHNTWFDNWDSVDCQKLVSLCLRNLPSRISPERYNVKPQEILRVLAQMTNLEALEIIDVPTLRNRMETRLHVKLLQLRRLTLAGEGHLVAAMLGSLELGPVCTCINIEVERDFYCEIPGTPDIHSLFPVSAIQSTYRFECLEVDVQLDPKKTVGAIPSTERIIFKAWRTVGARDEGQHLDFSLTMNVGTDETFSINKAILSFLNVLPQSTDRFDMNMIYSCGQWRWLGHLQRARGDEELRVESSLENTEQPLVEFETSGVSGNRESLHSFARRQLFMLALGELDWPGSLYSEDKKQQALSGAENHILDPESIDEGNDEPAEAVASDGAAPEEDQSSGSRGSDDANETGARADDSV
ncbi:hypothetical protein FA95DRAFT_1610299, partial [Auriscalpium vulgare]